jgi:hypothetical protein
MLGEAVGGATAVMTIAAAWWDLRKRTNGQGPIGVEQKKQGERLERIELHLRDVLRWQVDHMNDHLTDRKN